MTLTTTACPATDLGYLLHKHPDRVQTFELVAGAAEVFYPEATPDRCTVALMLRVDPIGLARQRKGAAAIDTALGQYVNDRPYAASSLLAVALGRVFRTAMQGRCDARPELAQRPLPLEVRVPALPCRGGADLARRLFEPLGWAVSATAVPLDPSFPEWGDSRYVNLLLSGEHRLADALNHLYVLMPVLDDAKHYWVTTDEVDKLVRAGAGWLRDHPERDLISSRYLVHRRELTRAALARLDRLDDVDDIAADALDNAVADTLGTDPPVTLAQQRHGAVLAALRAAGARRIADLGCGEGALLASLLTDPTLSEVVGVDVSVRALELAARRLRLDQLPEGQRQRLRLFQSSLAYRDERLAGLDAVVLMEVIEHVDPSRLPALERVVFGAARPATVVVTTPNAEHNVRFDWLAPGAFRHRDHRFEWTRPQFHAWAQRVATTYGYSARFLPVGADDPDVGPPTQLAVFDRAAGAGR
jgi:3' terminal RNA ribose 2'-O-methyltransferase Hen1